MTKTAKASRKREPRPLDSDALFIEDSTGNQSLSLGRLDQIEAALRRGDSLDDLRDELIQLVDWVAFDLVMEKSAHRGRPTNYVLKSCAAIVRELHTRHGIKLDAAVSAMVRRDVGTENSRRKLRQNIERAYRNLKAGGDNILVSEKQVLDALARINPQQNRK